MSLLYPRLLAGQAKPLFEEYRRLSVEELGERARTTHESVVYTATGGDRISEERLLGLREAVLELAREAGFPQRSTTKGNAAFDRRVAEFLHSHAGLMPAEAASGDVWAFLALVLLPDVAFWRYPSPPKDRVLGTDLTRHVFGRMWWRAQLVYTSDSATPYSALGVLGEAAFDQIYARRKALGGSPYLVKAILRVWGEVDLSRLKGHVAERDVLRDFLKRLLRLAPFVLFEALDEDQLDAELRTAVRESLTAMVGVSASPEVDAEVASVFDHRGLEPRSAGTPDSAPTGNAAPLQRRESADSVGVGVGAPGMSVGVDGMALPSYVPYSGPAFGDPRDLDADALAEAITAVVAVEGPVRGIRVFRVIAALADVPCRARALGSMLTALEEVIRRGRILAADERGNLGLQGATLRSPGQPPVRLRARGPRKLDEIPPTELVAATERVRGDGAGLADFNLVTQRVAALFGYLGARPRFAEYLAEALGVEKPGPIYRRSFSGDLDDAFGGRTTGAEEGIREAGFGP